MKRLLICAMIVALPRAHWVHFLITLRDLNKVLSKELKCYKNFIFQKFDYETYRINVRCLDEGSNWCQLPVRKCLVQGKA
jgi:hypothetical protein